MKRTSLNNGLLTGVINVFVSLLGIPGLVGLLTQEWFSLPSLVPGAWLLLLFVAAWGGARAVTGGSEENPEAVTRLSWRDVALRGLIAGAAHGLLVALFVYAVAALAAAGVPLREWLVQLTPEAIALLAPAGSPPAAAGLAFLLLVGAGLVGALFTYAAARGRWRDALGERLNAGYERVRAQPRVRALTSHRYARHILYGLGVVLLLLAPLVLGRYWNFILGTVGIYVILGLGLNVVVGMAGLLDLGYVAFFAIGAYTVALLTAPQPHALGWSFWVALPIGVVLASAAGVMLGIPVLRMRGDYLAIVTLGFGEIIRILSKSDVLTAFTGGPRGVRAVGGPTFFGLEVNEELHFMYFIILGILLVAYATTRLQNSRVGRAWMAIREDEDVAEAMGINTLKYKLLAFAIGAAFAGFSGVLFSSRNQFTGPEDFTLLVSINVLSLVIIGGMGSIPGVILGALVLKGLPEMLRQLSDYRMLAFGALLVLMMILRPEGLWPSKRRKMELHESDADEPPERELSPSPLLTVDSGGEA